MKKILAFILCVLLLCAAMTIATSAEEAIPPAETEVEAPGEDAPEKTMTEIIKDYVTEHIEEISVILTLLGTIFYEVRKHGKLNGSIGVLNNNAITVAEKSATAINTALDRVEEVANKVKEYEDSFNALLAELRVSEEEKKKLADALVYVENYLNSSKLANLEFADELANLLCLANIPNSKKEEFFSRHRAAVEAIAVAEKEVKEEVIENDGQEA